MIGYSGTYYAGHGHDIIKEGLGGSQILGGLGGKGSKEDWYGFSNNGSFGIGGDGSFEKASTQTGSGGGGGGYYGGGSGSQTKNGGWGHGGEEDQVIFLDMRAALPLILIFLKKIILLLLEVPFWLIIKKNIFLRILI